MCVFTALFILTLTTHAKIHLHTHTYTHAHIHTCTHTLTYTHTHIHTHTHTCTHTHTTDDSLGEYVCLTIEHVHSSLDSDDDDNLSFSLSRLVSKQYYIGPEGASLGTSPDCTICLPRESGLRERHVGFQWVPAAQENASFGNKSMPPPPSPLSNNDKSETDRAAGHFVMTEYPADDDKHDALCFGTTTESTHAGQQPDTIMEEDEEPPRGGRSPPKVTDAGLPSAMATMTTGTTFPSREKSDVLLTGRTFVTGLVEWTITALPPDTVLLLKMFAAVHRDSLEQLKSIVEGNRTRQTLVPHVAITSDSREVEGRGEEGYRHSMILAPMEQGVDVNGELCLPSLSSLLGEEPKGAELTQTLSSEAFKSEVAASGAQSIQASRKLPAQSHSKFLLHAAIDNGNLEMVQYLLEQGADVSEAAVCTHLTHYKACLVVSLQALWDAVNNSCIIEFSPILHVGMTMHCLLYSTVHVHCTINVCISKHTS